MINKELSDEEIDFSIGLIFIHLEMYFSDEEYPLSTLPRDTKLGDILDSVLNNSGGTVRELMKDVAKSNVSLKLSHMPEPSEFIDISKQIKSIKAITEIDISAIVNFFAPLTIQDVFSFQVSDFRALAENHFSTKGIR